MASVCVNAAAFLCRVCADIFCGFAACIELPAFFPKNQDPTLFLKQLLAERHPIYHALADLVIKNNGSLEETVETIASHPALWKNHSHENP